MLKTLFRYILLFPFIIAFASCHDEMDYVNKELGDSPTDVSVTLDFEPLILTDNNTSNTKSPGDALKDLDNLTVFLYECENEGSNTGVLTDIRYQNELSNLTISDNGASKSATFVLDKVKPGYYLIYAVANVGSDLIPTNKLQAMEDFAFPESLKNLKLTWNGDNITNNAQMFGYMTSTKEQFTDGFDASPVGIGINSNRLHCWLKRAASKVTVVFDGSGLHDNIKIYIKSVTIKDIPRNCNLGADNEPKSADELIESGETLYYDAQGVMADGEVNTDTDWKNWMQVFNGSGKKGAVTKDAEGKEVCHSETDQALYFYENLQGDYEGIKEKDKSQDWDKVGWIPENSSQPGYKDNVPCGSYIEVDAYYESNNPNQISRGPIKYRFMLGQNVTYNYNSTRNHHYNVTLGFKGYANQPDWHVVYKDEGDLFITVNNYYVSYQYNRKSIFPIRVKGNVTNLTVEIVENNWAPYHANTTADESDDVPPATVPLNSFTTTASSVTQRDFKWNKNIYDNSGTSNYYYGLQNPFTSTGDPNRNYSKAELDAGAPTKVTPIWAGFLALTVPGNNRDDIGSSIFHVNDGFSYSDDYDALKNYFYGQGGGTGKNNKNVTNNIPQNIRIFTAEDFNFPEGETEKTIGTGNNACTIRKGKDGSYTIYLPVWTRQKILMGISGFSGNNPYDAYRRRAKLMVSAQFGGEGSQSTSKVIVKDVFQVRRVTNPKGIWHKHDNTDPFHVSICVREDGSSPNFTPQKSDGAWKAYVQTTNGTTKFISLNGGDRKSGDTIIGSHDTFIEFDINFNGEAKYGDSRCALVRVEYHGYTTGHTIFVRQGYRSPLNLIEDGAHWSSFSLYGCKTSTSSVNDQFSESRSSDGGNYIKATITASPLSLGSLFKRGNYNGFRISNNANIGAGVAPGSTTLFDMSNGTQASWGSVQGLAYIDGYSGSKKWDPSDIHNTFKWRYFRAEITVPGTEQPLYRIYRVPEYKDFNQLLDPQIDSAVGVLYADGTTSTQMDVDYAYGFEDFENTGEDSGTTNENGRRGMRGIMLYNIHNAHQLFFPIGARGIGRRTITDYTSSSFDKFGTLRYGGVTSELTQAHNSANQYRPIPYDMPTAPGAIYWLDGIESNVFGTYLSWDMNYFDQNFNAYDYATSFSTDDTDTPNGNGGDALPIKLIWVKDE